MILIAGLALRLLLLPFRWINPDEGAHLLDARLYLQGLTPIADFGSRQPLYVAMIALFLKLGGIRLWVGRLMPVLASTGVSIVLYFLGKKLFDARAGLISAAIYAFLPLTLVWSTVVKTEPLTILFGCLSMLMLVNALCDRHWINLLLSGIFAACAFYVRQPALYLPMATMLFLLIRRDHWLRNLTLYAGGYLLVVGVVFLIFGSRMTLTEMVISQLNPTTLIFSRFYHLLGISAETWRFVDGSGFRILDQSMDYTLLSWQQALSFAALAMLPAVALLIFPFRLKERVPPARLLLYLWAGVVLMLYAYQTANRGFYSQYFTEALPPLILLCAAVVVEFFTAFPRRKMLYLAVPVFFVFLLAQKAVMPWFSSQAAQLMTAVALANTAIWFLLRERPSAEDVFSRLLLPMLRVGVLYSMAKLLGLHAVFGLSAALIGLVVYWRRIGGKLENTMPIFFLLVFGYFFSALSSGSVLGPRYESIWSPRTLAACAQRLRELGDKDDQVLSGAGSWTFESGLRPFLNVPHPTELLRRRRTDFENQFAGGPPQFIVLDGYTHRKFAHYWAFIEERMAVEYEKVAVIGGSKVPVEIYRRVPASKPLPGLLSEVNR